MNQYVSTPADQLLRAEVADTILYGMAEDPDFAEPKTFAKWQRAHKELLIKLFGGSGVQNLARVVAWCRREALQTRRDEAEVLCLISEAMAAQDVPIDLQEALSYIGIRNITDLLRAAMIEPSLSKSLLEAAPDGGLAAIMDKYFA